MGKRKGSRKNIQWSDDKGNKPNIKGKWRENGMVHVSKRGITRPNAQKLSLNGYHVSEAMII